MHDGALALSCAATRSAWRKVERPPAEPPVMTNSEALSMPLLKAKSCRGRGGGEGGGASADGSGGGEEEKGEVSEGGAP